VELPVSTKRFEVFLVTQFPTKVRHAIPSGNFPHSRIKLDCYRAFEPNYFLLVPLCRRILVRAVKPNPQFRRVN